MEEFIGEKIRPAPGELLAAASPGEPALPRKFIWRKKEYVIERVLEKWRDTGGCRHGSAERYVRKHWYRVVTADGAEMRLYFERQPTVRPMKRTWRLYTIVPPPVGRTP